MARKSIAVAIPPLQTQAQLYVSSIKLSAKPSTHRFLDPSPFLFQTPTNDRYDSSAQGYVYPISVTESALPTIQISIGDPNSDGGEQAFNIMPRDLGFAEASPGWVYGGFQDRGPSMNFDILGDVFLKNTYAVSHLR